MKLYIAAALVMALVGSAAWGADFDTDGKHKKKKRPLPGLYDAVIYVNSAVGGCLDQTGQLYDNGRVTYGGRKGDQIDATTPISGGYSYQVLTIESGLGSKTPSGNFTWSIPILSIDLGGTFALVLKPTGPHTALATLTEHYFYAGACTETLTLDLTWIAE